MMRATIGVKALRDAVTVAANATENRATIPILGMLKIDVDADGYLRVTGTDLDVEASARVPTISSEPGSVCVSARLKAMLRTLPNWESISLRQGDDHRVVVDMPDGRASFIGFPPDDFPLLTAEGDDGAAFELDCRQARRAIERVASFMSEEETRYYLNGIMMRAKDGKLQFVATNGHRLICECVADVPVEFGERIVPRVTVARLLKMLPRDGVLKATFNAAGTRVVFKMRDGDAVLRSKLIDGTYPNFERVIPREDAIRSIYTLNRASVLNAARRLECLIQKGMRAIELIEHDDGRLALSRSDNEFGSYVCAIAGTRDGGGEPVAVSIDLLNLQIALRAHQEATVRLSYIDAGSPIKVETAGILAIVMPMRGHIEKAPKLPDGAVA